MLRLATIGTSVITRALLDAAGRVDGVAFVGTVSRDAERAAAFTAEHGGTRAFTSVEEAAASPEVDAVYLASPNALHAAQALTCIHGGKHVLVEKPFGANTRDARAVMEAADAAGVVAIEAMRLLHDPAWRACQAALPELGRLRRANLHFGKYSSRYDLVLAGRQTNIFDCAMASGALMDIGIYTVNAMIGFFGAPERVSFAPVLLDEATRATTHGALDGAGVIVASYGSGLVASLNYSKITNDLLTSQIEGEAGTLTINAISVPSQARLSLRQTPGADAAGYSGISTASRELELGARANSMEFELADFAAAVAAVQAGAAPAAAPCGPYGTVGDFQAATLAALGVLDECRRQAGIAFPADADEPAQP